MKNNIALGLIDVQRGFMPTEEGERLGLNGFGELPVPYGQRIVPFLNKLLASDVLPSVVFTTQDWHPRRTAHFSENPDFNTTWPVHCVQGSPGAKLHPLLELPSNVQIYRKGQEILEHGEDDTSYSGFHATQEIPQERFNYFEKLPDRLKKLNIEKLILGGLALDYCVKATALDFKKNLDIDVIVISDATLPVAKETGRLALKEMIEAGIRILTTEEIINELRGE